MKNNRNIVILVVIVFYSLFLLSCNKESDSEENSTIDENKIEVTVEEEPVQLVDVVSHIITSPDSISIFVGYTSFEFNGGRVYAETDEQQMNQILAWFSKLDFKTFSECEEVSDDMTGKVFNLSLVKSEKGYHLDIYFKEDGTYISLTKWPSEINVKVVPIANEELAVLYGEPLPSSDVLSLNDTILDIMKDTDDEENCAIITVKKDFNTNFPTVGTTYNVRKAYSAQIVNVLDGTISGNNLLDNDVEPEYDLEIHIRDNIYDFNTITGTFTRNGEGVYLIEKSWLKRLLILMKSI